MNRFLYIFPIFPDHLLSIIIPQSIKPPNGEGGSGKMRSMDSKIWAWTGLATVFCRVGGEGVIKHSDCGVKEGKVNCGAQQI